MEIPPLATTPATSNLFYRKVRFHGTWLKWEEKLCQNANKRFRDGNIWRHKVPKTRVFFSSHIKLFKNIMCYVSPLLIKYHNLSVLWNFRLRTKCYFCSCYARVIRLFCRFATKMEDGLSSPIFVIPLSPLSFSLVSFSPYVKSCHVASHRSFGRIERLGYSTDGKTSASTNHSAIKVGNPRRFAIRNCELFDARPPVENSSLFPTISSGILEIESRKSYWYRLPSTDSTLR